MSRGSGSTFRILWQKCDGRPGGFLLRGVEDWRTRINYRHGYYVVVVRQ